MSTPRLVAFLVAFLVGLAGCVAANTIVAGIVADVNRGRPRAGRFSALGWHALKLARVLEAYRAAYPAGRRHRRLATVAAIIAAGWLCAAVALGVLG